MPEMSWGTRAERLLGSVDADIVVLRSPPNRRLADVKNILLPVAGRGGHDRLIAANRLRDMVVVETPDSIFVSDLEHSRDVKFIVTELKDRGRKEYQLHRTVYYPWGISKLLEQRIPLPNYSSHHCFPIHGLSSQMYRTSKMSKLLSHSAKK